MILRKLTRASVYETEGWWFEPSWVYFLKACFLVRNGPFFIVRVAEVIVWGLCREKPDLKIVKADP